jgi:hypothetical protein
LWTLYIAWSRHLPTNISLGAVFQCMFGTHQSHSVSNILMTQFFRLGFVFNWKLYNMNRIVINYVLFYSLFYLSFFDRPTCSLVRFIEELLTVILLWAFLLTLLIRRVFPVFGHWIFHVWSLMNYVLKGAKIFI